MRHPRTAPPSTRFHHRCRVALKGGAAPQIFGNPAHVAARRRGARARQILSPLIRRAYRRPITDEDLRKPLQFFREARDPDGFEAGIENALSAVLVSPRFLFRVEADPAGLAPATAYRISDLELASRLSFFIWSSLPDDALLDAAVRGDLRQPKLLEQQVRRLLADARSRSLVTNLQPVALSATQSATPDRARISATTKPGFPAGRRFFFGVLRRATSAPTTPS